MPLIVLSNGFFAASRGQAYDSLATASLSELAEQLFIKAWESETAVRRA